MLLNMEINKNYNQEYLKFLGMLNNEKFYINKKNIY